MLPGITGALFSRGVPAPTYGIDKFTTSLLKFDGVYNASLNSASLVDAVKPSRYWISGGATQLSAGMKFPGTSGYVDGTNIISPDPADPDYKVGMVTGQDFTIDFWMYPTGTTDGQVVVRYPASGGGGYAPFAFYQNPGGGMLTFYASSALTAWDIANAQTCGTLTTNLWQHHAVQRRGNVWSTWKNGVKQATWTTSLNTSPVDGSVNLGNNYPVSTNPWHGYIDELRFSSCARYDEATTFTPQQFPYYGTLNGRNDAATKLLLHMEDGTDSAAGPTLKTPHTTGANGGATFSATQAKFGSKSLQLNGALNNRLVVVDNSNDLNPYDTDFTVDFWYYRTSSNALILVAHRDTASQWAAYSIQDTGSGALVVLGSVAQTAWDINISIGTAALNAWTHIAFVCSNKLYRTYNNGVFVAQQSGGGPLALTTYNVSIGGLSDIAPGGSGFIDEVRISDVARWTGTASFTPPTSPY